jgi:surface antigen
MLLSGIAFAEAPTLCQEQTRTEHFIDTQGRESVRTLTEKVCVDNSHNLKRAGLAKNICGIPSAINPRVEQKVVTCFKPDQTWEMFDVSQHIDQTSIDSKQDIPLPNYFYYGGGGVVSSFFDSFFGDQYSLNDTEREAHTEAVTTALSKANLGQKVIWRLGKTEGFAMPVATFPSSQGFCRRVHIHLVSPKIKKATSKTACYVNSSDRWYWISDKY